MNHLICCFNNRDDGVCTSVLPRDIIQKIFFFVLLLEMISPVNKEMLSCKENGDTLPKVLLRITKNPQLITYNENAEMLANRCQEFINWGSHEFTYDLYSANIQKEISVVISRRDVLYLVGNRCKHSLVRSNVIINKLVKKYRDSGGDISEDEEVLIIEDIDNWFFEDFCGYHFTKICELLSNLYHAIIEYVRPQYEDSMRTRDGGRYYYEIPSIIIQADHRSEFYELLNRIRNPRIPIIQTDQSLIGRY